MPEGRFRDDLDVSDYIAKLGPGASPLRSSVMRVEGVDPSKPYVAGAGPLVCSPSGALLPSPQFSWDANGYYRAFGFRWPYRDVTRKALRLAGHAQRAHASAWRVFALKVLLNKGARREYDEVELGERYMDPFEQDRIKAAAQARASAVNSQLADLDKVVTGEDMLKEMGFEVLPEDEEDPEGEGVSEVSGTPWEWSFYVHKAPRIDLDALALWQTELIAEYREMSADYGRELEGFAVGIMGDSLHDWKVEVIGGEIVFFVSADTDLYHAADAMEWALQSTRIMRDSVRMKFTDN